MLYLPRVKQKNRYLYIQYLKNPIEDQCLIERLSLITIKSISRSETHLYSSKQIIISLEYLCLSYITMRNNDTIDNEIARTFICRHVITTRDNIENKKVLFLNKGSPYEKKDSVIHF